METGKEKKISSEHIRGRQDGDFLYSLDEEKHLFTVRNLFGEIITCIDLQAILHEYMDGAHCAYYDGLNHALKGFDSETPHYDIAGLFAGAVGGIRYDLYGGNVYFSYCSGVYRWNQEKNTLEKILDGSTCRYFSDMYGNFAVGKEESIYMLGYLGGGDDETASDFLYFTADTAK